MSKWTYISPFALALIAFSCGEADESKETEQVQTDSVSVNLHPAGDHYINEYGEVYISPVDDTTFQTTWINNENFRFDTVMYVAADSVMSIWRPWGEHIMLKYHWGGVIIEGDELTVHEFSSYGELASQTQIPELYTRSFYRNDKQIEMEGRLSYLNSHGSLNGIYFNPNPNLKDNFYIATGMIRKEPYPEIFWSTNNSPEGIEGIDENSFRLIFDSYTLVEPVRSIYAGTAINDSEGNACIAWDFADSEAYKLENREQWMGNEIGRKIFVEGYLTQDPEEGSILRNWTMDLSYEIRLIEGTKTNLNGNGGIAPKDFLIHGYELEGHGTWLEDEVNELLKVRGRLTVVGEQIVVTEYEFVN